MKNFNEFRTINEGEVRGSGNAQYYHTDNESTLTISDLGTPIITLNAPRMNRSIAKTGSEMQKLRNIAAKLKHPHGDALYAEAKKIISDHNIAMGKQLEKAEKQFKKQLAAIINKNDAAIAGKLKQIDVMPGM